MLTADQFDAVIDDLVIMYQRYEDSVIQDVARRLAKSAVSSAAWQVQRLTESGALYDDILGKLEAMTGQSETALRQTFERAGVQAMRFDDAIYRRAGLHPTPLNLSPAMLTVLTTGIQKTGGSIRNLTMTTALTGQEAYISAADLMYTQVATGVMSYQAALKAGVQQVASEGLRVISFPGRQDHIDVALRRTMLTGIGQTTGEMQLARAAEMGCDLVQTSAHAGARPTHQVWQGHIFSRSGQSRRYPPFVESTGYGTVTGLAGANCRHSFYPFYEGISENAYIAADLKAMNDKTVTYQGQEIGMYDATQQQRAIERKIRYWKRQAGALDAAGLDNGAELAQVREYQAQMRDFIRQTGLNRQREREQVYD